MSFAAAARPQAFRVVESAFVVNALQEKEKASQKDIAWDQFKAFDDFDVINSSLEKLADANALNNVYVYRRQDNGNKFYSVSAPVFQGFNKDGSLL